MASRNEKKKYIGQISQFGVFRSWRVFENTRPNIARDRSRRGYDEYRTASSLETLREKTVVIGRPRRRSGGAATT